MANRANIINGAGIGLRSCHYKTIIETQPAIGWFEAVSENYMVDGGPSLNYLDAIRQNYPMVLHGVGLSLGSTEPLNQTYLKKLKHLQERVEPTWISDHLSWSSAHGQYLHDLLPLPFTQEAINHVVERIRHTQDYLGTQILIENPSSYFEFKEDEMTEWTFINTIANQADCFILLDINNVYVSAINHGFDPEQYLANIAINRVKQFHLAGFTDNKHYLFDTHGELIKQPVWDLYQVALQRFGKVPTLIEWDQNIPPLSTLMAEANKAEVMMNQLREFA